MTTLAAGFAVVNTRHIFPRMWADGSDEFDVRFAPAQVSYVFEFRTSLKKMSRTDISYINIGVSFHEDCLGAAITTGLWLFFKVRHVLKPVTKLSTISNMLRIVTK